MSTLVPSQVTPSEDAATTLVAKLRESGRVGKAEWMRYRSVIEDLKRTLKFEPLTFEDAFSLYLVDDGWTAEEAWKLAKIAAREIPSVKMREALEAELREAQGHLDDFARNAPSDKATDWNEWAKP